MNRYEEQWQAIEAVIQLLECDWILAGCYRETEFDCLSCEAVLARKLLKQFQQEYFEEDA